MRSFDLQRFAVVVNDSQVTIPAGENYNSSGVTYTALDDATLNLDGGKVSGIASGKVTAAVTGQNNPTVTFDASDGSIDFTATGSGSVLTVKQLFPIEFISGEFTYKGNKLSISAGSDLAIINTSGNYSLRNENHFVYDSAYIFNSTSMVSDAEQVISTFTLSNGSNVRQLNLEQLGKVINNFLERGFTLVKGSSEVLHIGDYTLTATAINDAALNIELGANGLSIIPNQGDGTLNVTLNRGDVNIISGELECTSGSITFGYNNVVTFEKDTSFKFMQGDYVLTATTTDKATGSIALTSSGISFTPGKNDGGLNLSLSRGGKIVFGGELNVSGGTISFNPATQKFSVTRGTEISLKLAGTNPQEFVFKVTGGNASFKVEADGSGNFIITPDTGDGSLDIMVKQNGATIFANNISVSSGSIIIGNMGQTIGLTAGTSMTVTLGNYALDITATDDASFGLGVLSDGSISITPRENDGALDISIRRGGTTIFRNTVNISGGTISFNPATQTITLMSGTKIALNFNGYELIATARGNAASVMSITGKGISITPNTGDGTLDLTLKSSSGSMSANLEVLSGSFILGDGGALTVAKDTELRIDFGGGYVINFKATDDAGGAISLGADGITFKPNSADGGLELSITRGGQTRTASLDVTGSVTYKLDGSISLTKGTVVRNVFDSGNVLTIKANTAASGSMVFTPQNGLTITPSTPDALNVTLMTDDVEVVNITSITGSINYTGGVVTASDGTKAHISYYFGWDSELRTEGGTASLQFTADRTIYTANEGATFILDYLDGTTAEIQNGTYSDIYATETSDAIELVSVGSTFNTNDYEQVITLDKAGYYTLNGLKVRTTSANAQVRLVNYDTVIVDGIGYSSTGDNAVLNISDGGSFVTGGSVSVTFSTGMNIPLRVDASTGRFSFDKATRTISVKAGTKFTLPIKNLNITAEKDFSIAITQLDGKFVFTTDDIAFSLKSGASLSVSGGSIIVDPSDGTISVDKGTSVSLTRNGQVITFTAPENISAAFKNEDDILYFMPDANATANISVTRNGQKILDNATFKLGGVVSYRPETGTFGLTGSSSSHGDGTDTFVQLTMTHGDSVYTFKAATNGVTLVFIPEINGNNLEVNFPNEAKHAMKFTLTRDGQPLIDNDVIVDGTIGLDISAQRFYMTKGTTAQISFGTSTITATATDDAGFKISSGATGNIQLTFTEGDGDIQFSITNQSGSVVFANNISIVGTIELNPFTSEFSMAKGTVISLSLGDNKLNITALNKAGGLLNFVNGGLRFAPNEGDGKLELNFVTPNRKAIVDVSGAVVLNDDATISLEEGAVVNLEWESGTQLKMTASADGGSIGFDDRGLKISGNGEISIDLTLGDVQTQLSDLNGTIHYNAGTILFDENSKVTATSTLGGQPINLTLESSGSGGYVEVSANGTNYVAGTGALTITWERGGLESTFSINSGSVYIGHGIFQIANGTDLSTDLKDFVPALYFTTSEAGTYTINGQKITTTAANLSMTATDDRMTFNPGDDIVEYGGMLFTGNGNVSLTQDGVILGAGIEATGFGKANTFILTEKGSVTADGKIFELTEDVPTGISVKGAQDGFSFARTLTRESEARLGIYNSPDIGKVFAEEFSAKGDDTYRVQTDLLGLQKIIGFTAPVTLDAAAYLGDDSERTVFDLVTETEGVFKIGNKAYTISGDSSVEIKALFNSDEKCARGFDDLSGTVSGDFTAYAVSINGGRPIQIHGDKTVAISAGDDGVELFNVSNGVTLDSTGKASKVHTDTEGVFQFGATADDSIAITIQGDKNVTFELNSSEFIENITDVEGDLLFSETSNTLFINGMGGTFDGEFSSIGAYDNSLYIHDITGGSELSTGDADKIWLQMRGETFTLNGNELTLTADADGIWLRDKEIIGLDEGASLRVSEGGTYTVNEAELKVKSGEVIVGLAGNDAYIYDASNPPITRNTPNEDIIKHFKPENTSVIGSQADVTLSGGELAIVENISAQVNITAGADTIVSKGENVHATLTGGNTWLYPLEGKMTLEGYDASTGSGFNPPAKNILSEVESGYIDFDGGKLSIGAAQVDLGKSSALMNFYSIDDKKHKVGYASRNDSLDLSDETDNLLLVAKKNATLTGGSGNDTIFANAGAFVDGGAGSNFVTMSGGNSNIVFNGKTTVEGFNTGFGSGSDTLYIPGDPAGVDFKADGLTFIGGNNSVLLSDVTDTAKVNLFHRKRNVLNKGVFIAQDKWYKVESSDLSLKSGEEVYFVGPNATGNYGVDFSGISQELNITLDTAYVDSPDYVPTTMWVNSVHSIKGGAGKTTIVGSALSDTIFAGTGASTLSGGKGHDKIYGSTSTGKQSATFIYAAGDGRDSIENFDYMSSARDKAADKVQFDDSAAIDGAFLRGSDVMIKVEGSDGFLMLEGAQGKSFRLNDDLIAKVDDNVEFDGFSNFYVGAGRNSTLTVGQGMGKVEVWLSDDSLEYHGTRYDGDFVYLDASQSDGRNILAGNELSNVITGGSGNNTLWGGTYGDDVLIGGSGRNTFIYSFGNGNDRIQNANDGDKIILDDITLDQIKDTNITANRVAINFTDGGSLIVEGSADVTYQLGDGTKFNTQ